jgi:hypothetical protein
VNRDDFGETTWRISSTQSQEEHRSDLATNKGDKQMTDIETRDMPLNWDVFVTPGIPVVTSDLPPGTQQRMWSPTSATLIYGQRDAVLVDALLTVEQAHALVEWVEAHAVKG